MSGQTEILREYLFSLGFRVNQTEVKKFDTTIDGLDKKALKLGGALLGVAAAAQVMVERFSAQMEKLYYAGKRTDSTVAQIQGIQYGAKQIGLSGEQMLATLEGMSRAMRGNPGLESLLGALGVAKPGQSGADKMIALVERLKSMPFYVAQQYASMFGIDPDTLFMLEEGLDKLKAAAAARKEMADAAGVDADAAARASVEYQNMLRQVTERMGLLKDAVGLALLGPAHEFAGVVNEVLKSWTKIAMEVAKDKTNGAGTTDKFWIRMIEGLTGKQDRGYGHATSGVTLTPDAAARAARLGLDGKSPPRESSEPAGSNVDGSLLDRIERAYGLPSGLLAAMRKKESGGNNNAVSPKGAQGPFQFLPGTAKDMGVANPFNLADAANGAGRYMANLLARYGGDLDSALAAYNWGMGNVDKKGLGSMPRETRDYVRDIKRDVTLNQKTDIHVSGGDNDTAQRVAREQRTVNADLVRNFQGAVN